MVNIEILSKSTAIVNGNRVCIDTIYGNPCHIGPIAYYIYTENDGNYDFGNTFYTYEISQIVFDWYLEVLRLGTFVKLREFEESIKACLNSQEFRTRNCG